MRFYSCIVYKLVGSAGGGLSWELCCAAERGAGLTDGRRALGSPQRAGTHSGQCRHTSKTHPLHSFTASGIEEIKRHVKTHSTYQKRKRKKNLYNADPNISYGTCSPATLLHQADNDNHGKNISITDVLNFCRLFKNIYEYLLHIF